MATFDEAYERIPGNGWLSKAEAELLWTVTTEDNHGKPRGVFRVLEVGCYQGRSSVLLAQTGAEAVYCVDPFDGFHTDYTGDQIEAMWRANTKSYPNLLLDRCRIEDWKPRKVNVAYLDGDHTYQGTVNQLRVALQCRPETIAVHDVNDSGDGVMIQKAAVELLGPWSERVERLAVWDLGE